MTTLANDVQVELAAAISETDTSATIVAAVTPLNNPPTPDTDSVLTLVDTLGSPAKVEIVRYTTVTDNGDGTLTIGGLTRGQEGTTAQSFDIGAIAYQAVTAGVLAALTTPEMLPAVNAPQPGWLLGFGSATEFQWVDPATIGGASIAVDSVSPASGSVGGGTPIIITGTGFDVSAAASVTVGGNTATGATVDSTTRISATTSANEKPVLMDAAKKGSNITLDATGLIVSNESGIDDLSQAILADTSESSGKHYAEFVMTEITDPITAGVGLAPDAFAFSTDWIGKGSSYAHWKAGLFTGGSNVNSRSFATGDVIMVAFDADAGKIWFGKNGTWYDSGDPGAGTGEQFSGVTGAYAIAITPWDDGSIVDVVTESGELSHTIPTGFDPWIKTVAESVDVTVTQGSESGTLAGAFEYVLA